MPDPHSAAGGTLLALQFVACLAAEFEGEEFPDPYLAVGSGSDDMRAALTIVTGLLEVQDTPEQRAAVVRFLAAMADMIEQQGMDLQMCLQRLRNGLHAKAAGTLSAEKTQAGNLMIQIVTEMPDFSDVQDGEAALDAVTHTTRQIIQGLVEPVADAVFSAAGFARRDEAGGGP